jgi:hypothetical protein
MPPAMTQDRLLIELVSNFVVVEGIEALAAGFTPSSRQLRVSRT